LLFAAWAVVALCYASTLVEMGRVWTHSRNYIHGWLILPICAWLLWRERDRLRTVPLRRSALGLSACLTAVALWLPAYALQVNVIAQVAVIGLLIATLWAAWGGVALRALWFPAAFALLAVPFSEGFVPWLMEWTATATIALLRLTGFFVVREGMLFSTVAGDFAVAEACSGVRYLTITVTAGALYAYLQFRTTRFRLGFVMLAACLALAGNVFRAYGLVVIGHTFGMEHAAGIDHFVHGSVFFGILMLALFAMGAVLSRRERAPPSTVRRPPGPQAAPEIRPTAGIALWVAVVALGPMLAYALQRADRRPLPAATLYADGVGEWRAAEGASECATIDIERSANRACRAFEHSSLGNLTVAVVAARARASAMDLLATEGRVTNPDAWRLVAAQETMLSGLAMRESTHEDAAGARRLRIWQTYWFNQSADPRRIAVAWRYLQQRATGGNGMPKLLVIISPDYPGAKTAAEDFAREWATRARGAAKAPAM
jgi:exosortase A